MIPDVNRFLRVVFRCLLALSLGQAPAGRAEDPSREPRLCLETGTHTGRINRISADASGRLLLTASEDKTARLWNLESGQLLRVLRVPQGPDKEGVLHACALSPDGRVAAVGGNTGASWDRSCAIYLFDTATGLCLRRIPGLPSVIMHLVFSADGSRLAACLWGRNGMRILDPSSGRELAWDTAYDDLCMEADFDAAGRLATSSWDGLIRLYDPAGKLLAKAHTPGGNKPYAVRFSPDGTRLAVGHFDTPHVDVLGVPGLEPLFQPEDGPGPWALWSVAWSKDGNTLFAGACLGNGGGNPLRSWTKGGRGAVRDAEVGADNNLTDLATLPCGGPAWGSFDAAWGQGSGTAHRPASIDFLCMSPNMKRPMGLGLDATGTRVAFRYTRDGEPCSFDLPARSLRSGPDRDLAEPRIDGLALRWKYQEAPTLSGRSLGLAEHDHSRCLAISADGSRFALGTEMSLRVYDAKGTLLWRRRTSSIAEAVNLSGDGRLVVVAYQDGLIRWHRMSDGQELLTLFPHADRKRWVLWTPSGYYDCAPGSEDFLGWHVNRGQDQAADFFPISRFRAKYYRPDVVDRILATLDEAEALRTAAAPGTGSGIPVARMLPPVVRIAGPGEGAAFQGASVDLEVRVRPTRGPVERVWAAVDGRRLEAPASPLQAAGDEQACRLTVPVPPRDCAVSVFAQSGTAVSEAATVRLRWQGAPADQALQPRLYLLAVGVSKYQQRDLALDFPAKDARDLARAFLAQKGRLYRDVEAKVLVDEAATRDAVLQGLEWLERQTTARDVAALFLAGHGLNDPAGSYFFLPFNADPEHIKTTMIPGSEFQATLAALPGKALLFLDSCHSGSVLKVKLRGAATLDRFVNELASAENGVVVFSASTGRQASQESPLWGNGAFTKALVEGLDGKADFRRTGRITVNMLDLYISERVKELTSGRQAPTTVKPEAVEDFPVAVAR